MNGYDGTTTIIGQPYDGMVHHPDPNLVETFDDMPTGIRGYVVRDVDASVPDWDGLGYVFGINDRTARADEVLIGGDHGDNPPDVAVIRTAWNRWRDWDMVARYLRMFHGAVSVDVLSRDYYTAVAVVTAGQATSWGCDPIHWAGLAGDTLHAYEQWADGQVYGVIVVNESTGEEESLWDIYDDSPNMSYCRSTADELTPAGWGESE